MTIQFSSEPYFDDYNKHKHFYKILFRPSYSLQARELSQIQSMLQEQVKRMGDHIFKNGTMVIPGELSFDNKLQYIKVNPTFSSVDITTYIDQLVGQIVIGGTSNAQAQVIAIARASGNDPNTIFVKYLDSGTSGATTAFQDNETISPIDVNFIDFKVHSLASQSTGTGSSASVKEGVYYINGYFVLCESQTVVLDKYTNTPTYSIGFKMIESIVTPELDETLLDNAQGSYNFAAPGGHRFAIELVLTKKTTLNDQSDADDYIQLTSLLDGEPQTVYNQTQYAELAKVMARRTYDESGDYVVRDFKFSVRDSLNDDRGEWAAGIAYLEGDQVSKGGLLYSAETDGTSGSGVGTWPTDELTNFSDGGVTWRHNSRWISNNGVYDAEQGIGNKDTLAIRIEPGKAYVRGYEVEKVAASYVLVPKARTFRNEPNGRADALVGNYVLVTRVHGLPDISTIPLVEFYSGMTTTAGLAAANGVLLGTGRVRYFEFHSGTIGTASAIYKVGLFDVNLTAGVDFAASTKQCFVNTGTQNTNFTADIAPILTLLPGTISITSGAVTGINTLFTSLKLEDVISVNGALHRVTVITNNTSMTVAASPDTVVNVAAGTQLYKATTIINEPQNSSVVYWSGNTIKSLPATTLTYTTTEVFSGSTDGTAHISFTISSGAGNGNTFASAAIAGNYIGVYGAGVIKELTANEVVLSGGNKTVTINFGTGQESIPVKVIATVHKVGTDATQKTKVLTYTTETVTTLARGTAKKITLPKADGYQLFSVKMKSGVFGAATGTYSIDITNRFTFNDGQTDSYYGLSYLSLIDGMLAPISDFSIIYSYWAHSSTGDYFTVDSYGSEQFDNLPWDGDVPLADCIDFRPRISDDGTGFTGTGSSPSYVSKRGYEIAYKYDYYLGRIDRLCIEPNGEFHLVQGKPSDSPIAPNPSPTGMLLSTIYIDPYTFRPDISVNMVNEDNRRYTMRDIGKLEKRIANLEYYTTLTMTETNTANMNISDSSGFSRYKNGFIVDSFNGHGIGDALAPDYHCSIDAENGILRPYVVMKNVTLYEANTTNRTANHYTMTGDLITLPYTHSIVLKQPFASRYENVNPFAVYTFTGQLDVNPQSDDWMETQRAPDIVTNVEGNYNQIAGSLQYQGVLGTIYNAWQTVWAGVPTVTQVKNVTATGGGITTTKFGSPVVAGSTTTISTVCHPHPPVTIKPKLVPRRYGS